MKTAIQQSHQIQAVTVDLSPVQAQVVAILAEGHSITAAARQAGIHRSAIYHWLQRSPDFKTTVEDAQQEYLATLSDEMRDLSASALRTLRGVLDNPETHDAIRLKAVLAPAPALPEPRLASPRAHRIPAPAASNRYFGGNKNRI